MSVWESQHGHLVGSEATPQLARNNKRFNSIDDSVVHEPASDYMDIHSEAVLPGLGMTRTPSMVSFGRSEQSHVRNEAAVISAESMPKAEPQ